MNSPFRIEIRPHIHDSRLDVFSRKIQSNGFAAQVVGVTDVYTVDHSFTDEQKEEIAGMLINPIVERASFAGPNAPENFDVVFEVGYLPGVTDNVGTTVIESIEDRLKTKFDRPAQNVYSSQQIFLTGATEEQALEIAGLFSNPLINRITVKSKAHYDTDAGMEVVIPQVKLQHEPKADTVNLDLNEEELLELGKKGILNEDGTRRGPLALRLSYLKTIQAYFEKEGRQPTDVELEAIAQTWSEHCKHTIFADPLDDVEKGVFKHYIRRATVDIREAKGEDDFCVSVFTDNAGGIIFDDEYVVTDKAETHNSPSALGPFGGAVTGIVGVNRDALGYGMGAKPVVNRYGFCFGDPDTYPELYRQQNKENRILSPRTIMDGVIAGVNAGGNESGIPSPQGFVYYDERYSGKPLVFVGTIGLIPRLVNGKDSAQKQAQPGDRIIVAGGRVGLDGIHGATFSSEALDSGSPSTAVQIGDPITQKKLSDVIIKEARDRGLYSSITDNGAGGISCSVAEMARECGGCTVELERVPLKYPNLSPWEIWISESQERMTFAVPPEKVDEFMALMKRRDVEATDIGEFTGSGRCTVNYNGQAVLDLEMEFLHDGLPAEQQVSKEYKPEHETPEFEVPSDLGAELLNLLKSKNITSFRFISRQFDHEVQGGSVIKPLQGPGQVNGSATVTRPVLTTNKAVVTSQGINPAYSDIDCYHMVTSSIDDAVAAAVAVGADVDHMAIMDNFCWCSSDEPERLYQLKQAGEACYDIAVAYGTPYISGKDSMFNDFKGYDENNNPVKVSVPPTMLASALSVIPDAHKAMSMDFKMEGDLIYVIGETKDEMGASAYWLNKGYTGMSVPQVNTEAALSRYRRFFEAAQKNMLNSALHIDRGGLGVALAKAVIAGELGAQVDLSTLGLERADIALFSESKSRFLVSIAPEQKEAFEALFPEAQALGTVGGTSLEIASTLSVPVSQLTETYHSTFKDY